MIGTSIFRPTLIAVDGSYDDVNRLCAELADCVDWGFCNLNLRAYYSEGSKTLTFETAEQLGWRLPDEIIVPVASGCQFVKHRKAAGELIDLGLVDAGSRLPRLTGAQAAGCSPVATAFAHGDDLRGAGQAGHDRPLDRDRQPVGRRRGAQHRAGDRRRRRERHRG